MLALNPKTLNRGTVADSGTKGLIPPPESIKNPKTLNRGTVYYFSD